MSEQALHAAQVGAGVEQMRGETVAQFVRAGRDGNLREAEVFFDRGACAVC